MSKNVPNLGSYEVFNALKIGCLFNDMVMRGLGIPRKLCPRIMQQFIPDIIRRNLQKLPDVTVLIQVFLYRSAQSVLELLFRVFNAVTLDGVIYFEPLGKPKRTIRYDDHPEVPDTDDMMFPIRS